MTIKVYHYWVHFFTCRAHWAGEAKIAPQWQAYPSPCCPLQCMCRLCVEANTFVQVAQGCSILVLCNSICICREHKLGYALPHHLQCTPEVCLWTWTRILTAVVAVYAQYLHWMFLTECTFKKWLARSSALLYVPSQQRHLYDLLSGWYCFRWNASAFFQL